MSLKTNHSLKNGGGGSLLRESVQRLSQTLFSHCDGRKISAFTLTELLVAIGIVGAIAAMSIPSMVNNIQNRLLTTQLKSITLSIKQLADEQMIKNKTKDLTNTDFADPATLMTSSNFSIAENCAGNNSACWGKDKYRSLNGGTSGIPGNGSPEVGTPHQSVKLKNGVVISYSTYKKLSAKLTDSDDVVLGKFSLDVNGTDKPNIAGRDYFIFYISKKGMIVDKGSFNAGYNDAAYLSACKNGSTPSFCYELIVKNNWKMPY